MGIRRRPARRRRDRADLTIAAGRRPAHRRHRAGERPRLLQEVLGLTHLTVQQLQLAAQREAVHRAVARHHAVGPVELAAARPPQGHAPREFRGVIVRQLAARGSQALLGLVEFAFFHQ